MNSADALQRIWQGWIRPFVAMEAIIYPFKSAIAGIHFVPTGSMKPAVPEGDVIFVNKLGYDLEVPFTTRHLAKWNSPARGDMTMLLSPEDGIRHVKRLVAVPGDTIELRANVLFAMHSEWNATACDRRRAGG